MRRTGSGGGLNVEVTPTYEAMSQQVADLISVQLKKRPQLLLCASAGGTPTGVYQCLATRFKREPARFRRMRVLQIDEWSGLAADHPATCKLDLEMKLIRPLGIKSDRFVSFMADAPEPRRECERISSWLAGNGPIDVCILGLGTNGHVAMNEPTDAFVPNAHVAKLAPSSQKHPLLKDLRRKPRYGLTLGMAEILRSRKILLLVSGAHKKEALAEVLKPRVTTRFPASLLWLHPDATVVCDREAAAGLRV